MIELLNRYLELITTPQSRELLVDAYGTLSLSGSTEHQQSITFLLDNADAFPAEENLMDINSVLKNSTVNALRKYGVICNNEGGIKTLTTILKAMAIIPDYGDTEALTGVLSQDISCKAQLAEIIFIVMQCPVADSLETIDYVLDDLLDAIRTSVEEDAIEDDVVDVDIVADYEVDTLASIKAVKRWIEAKGTELVIDLKDNGVPVGTPLKQILDSINYQIEAYEDNADMLCEELLGLVIYSGVSLAEARAKTEELIELYAVDINVNSLANRHLDEIEIRDYYVG